MKLNKRQRRLWDYRIRQLKRHFNPGVPVQVKTVPTSTLKGYDGDSDGIIKLGRLVKIIIRINADCSWKEKSDALMHEWAHAMEWDANWTDDSPKKEHGETWGVWYAKIYSYLIDTCWEEMKKLGLLGKDGTQ
jgi:hypothetical protein